MLQAVQDVPLPNQFFVIDYSIIIVSFQCTAITEQNLSNPMHFDSLKQT